jgi:hypothetical protein
MAQEKKAQKVEVEIEIECKKCKQKTAQNLEFVKSVT